LLPRLSVAMLMSSARVEYRSRPWSWVGAGIVFGVPLCSIKAVAILQDHSSPSSSLSYLLHYSHIEIIFVLLNETGSHSDGLHIHTAPKAIMSCKITTSPKGSTDHQGPYSFSSSSAATAKDREFLARLDGGCAPSLTTFQQRRLLNTKDAPNRCSVGLILLVVMNHMSLVMASRKILRKCTPKWTRLCVSFRRILAMASSD
jgi:hypothetical protein